MSEENKSLEINLNGVFKDAVKVYGERSQITMFFEESAELQELLAKYVRGRNVDKGHICEEIADVLVVVFQLMEIFNQQDVWLAFMGKVERLKKRVEEAKKEKEEKCG